MLGYIHECLHQLVVQKFGKQTWLDALAMSHLKNAKIDIGHYYTDSETLGLFAAVSKIENTTMDDILEKFGKFLMKYAFDTGWELSLKALASDLEGFLSSIDTLHYFVHNITFKAKLKGPSFRCEANHDGSLTLHYYSKHCGLHPLVKGAIEDVAVRLFDQLIKMKVVSRNQEVMGNDEMREHVIFLIDTQNSEDNSNLSLVSRSTLSLRSEYEQTCRLSLKNFAAILPYHVCFDRDLVIHQFGFYIKKTLPLIKKGKTKLTQILHLIHPDIPMGFDNFSAFISGVFVFRLKPYLEATTNIDGALELKGQMILLEDMKFCMFVCSPNLTTVNDLLQWKLYFNEIPIHDATRNVILLNQACISQTTIQNKLEKVKAAVKKTASDLDFEREKNENLLKELLPGSVAEALQNGRTVAPAEFAEATVLYADVVSFTVLCSKCTPYDVVDFLNTMFIQFDRLTTVNNVYKVETIGDAYVVVGGVPNIDKDHATNVCNMALGMMWATAAVKSPVESHNLQIRVGIHSGSVVAGVVGQKMPRYCLFGDTVNVAHQMESTGVPSRIVVSSNTHKQVVIGLN